MTNPFRIAVTGAAALIVAIVAWSAGGEHPDDAARRQEIAMKSEAERELLRRRYEAFQKMSPDERGAIRVLHEAIDSDPALAQSLDKYEAFVSRLDPWDQQELRSIEDPSRRIEKIRELISEHSPSEGPGRPSWLAGRGSDRWTFPPAKFDEAMNLVVGLLNLSESDQDELKVLAPAKRHFEIAAQAAERFHKQSRWADKADFEKIVNLLPDDGFREFMLREQTPAEFSRRLLAYTLMKSLHAEWQDEIRRHVPHDAIRQVLDDMNDKDQAEMSSRDPDRLMYKVMEVLATTSDDEIGDFAKDFVKVAQLKAEFDPRRGGFGWPRSDDRGDRGRPGPPHGRGPDDGGGPPPPDERFRGPDERDGRFGDGRRGPGPFGGPGSGGPRRDDFRDRDSRERHRPPAEAPSPND